MQVESTPADPAGPGDRRPLPAPGGRLRSANRVPSTWPRRPARRWTGPGSRPRTRTSRSPSSPRGAARLGRPRPARHGDPQPRRQRRRLLRAAHPRRRGRARGRGRRSSSWPSPTRARASRRPTSERIFERFYRVDAGPLPVHRRHRARPRDRQARGGEPRRRDHRLVASRAAGSTFTLRLPSMTVGRQRDADSPPDGRHAVHGPPFASTHLPRKRPTREPHTRRRGRGVVLRPPLVPAAPRGLRGGRRRDRAGGARPVRQERRRPRPARPHAARPVRHRRVPAAAPAHARCRSSC